ncbi:coiled-coil domain-containing protein 27 isoform X1 [Gopherus flavomarginatus]|uniref:coiled-coil domain-containing protein 27 isoform X1 n=1 Tax=Gopherus flavomarginatus TaxID=286002 RepID=UPI0021CBADBC|nr:coiled-coil domain-containing protein 27 isoform X1 [Gopherus flavomarginatus]XP_050787651.1 coiled-coil domain-containing protein 27 isoform X1 [Gopherus flavomarginatus]
MNLMTKGFSELQELSSRRQQTPVWKLPSGRSTLSKSAQAVRRYYENQADIKPAGFSESEYEPQVKELQRSFLMRPGCPRFSNRATSTSQLESTLSDVPDLSFNLSTISLSSQLNFEEWNAAFQNTYPSELATKAAGQLLPTKSFTGLSKWKSFTEGIVPAEQQRGPIESKIPWYIDVIREKERCLLMMGEEISRLSRCKAECARKDDVISILREEMENLKKHLELLRRESVITKEKDAASEPVADDSKTKMPRLRSSVQDGLGESGTKEDLREEVACLKLKLSYSDKMLDSKIASLSESLMKDQEELWQLEKEYSEMQQKGLRQEDMEKELLSGTEIEVASEEEGENEAEAEEKASLIKLREFQQMNQELCKELEKAKTDYDMATGAITSLQRQLAFQESQLRRAESEKEMLQKELRERGNQLQAMSAKFSSLREERKREEMMGIIERENYKLRQDIVEQESKLAEKNKLIDDLQSKINQLQAEVMVAQHHMQKQLCDQSEMQNQVEALKHAEQQAKVALECISARFERFRSKIIQATYSAAGAKSPQAEISDEEALEAMQRIISERLDFHQMLKQKGVKVPSLFSTEPANLSSPNSKTTKKSPVK